MVQSLRQPIPATRVWHGHGVNSWILGARPRTLPAAVVPVAIGAGCAVGAGSVVWWRVAVALAVSLALQVGVNYANDYSDGVRGTDDRRVGPVRLVASGLKRPAEVRRAAFVAFGVAAVSGLALAATTSWWLLVVGAAAIAAAWGYTGGPRPYGYAGLGELFVFVFFGLVATVGTTYVAIEEVTGLSLVMGCASGCLACALLVVNNLRDIPSDTSAGKRTLAVRLGDARTRQLYLALLAAAYVFVVVAAWSRTWVLLALASAPLAGPAVHAVRAGAHGRALIAVLGRTGLVQLAFGTLATIGLVLSA
jgi:1,4-dihydroxy-2-naphthoate octaprenyltransferase